MGEFSNAQKLQKYLIATSSSSLDPSVRKEYLKFKEARSSGTAEVEQIINNALASEDPVFKGRMKVDGKIDREERKIIRRFNELRGKDRSSDLDSVTVTRALIYSEQINAAETREKESLIAAKHRLIQEGLKESYEQLKKQYEAMSVFDKLERELTVTERAQVQEYTTGLKAYNELRKRYAEFNKSSNS